MCERERERASVCVCVCVKAREGQREEGGVDAPSAVKKDSIEVQGHLTYKKMHPPRTLP